MTGTNTPAVERRVFDSPVEFRAAPEGSASPGVLTGYACVFNAPSRALSDYWLGEFTESVDPGAFGAPVEGMLDLRLHTRVIGRTNHDSNQLLGTTDAETLRVFLDDVGVRYEIDLPDTSYARDLAVSAKRGDYRYSSFAFRTLPDGEEWEFDSNDQLMRRITSARLIDVAPVADPAYWASSTEMKRSFDLEQIRASLKPAPAPPGEREKAFAQRARTAHTTTVAARSVSINGPRRRREIGGLK
tara:strand:- start:633 stop:1364 length:732 start_codon:yes stop_codon:yes gene_type:complete